jgi:predicted outer membrane lipoprotein
MSRNFYYLAATLLVLSLLSCGMIFTQSAFQPGLPGNGSLWKTTALFLFLGAVLAAFMATLTAMFEQVERRNRQRLEGEAARRRKR